MAAFSAMKALSTRNDDPERASRPFDRDRDGFVMGEGAGVVVVEELEHAKTRGAKIYCELTGYGLSADAYHMTRRRRMAKAPCARCRWRWSTRRLTRTRSITSMRTAPRRPRRRLRNPRHQDGLRRPRAERVSISSTKSMTGHLLGGAGGVEMAACALAIRDSVFRRRSISIIPTRVRSRLHPERRQGKEGARRHEQFLRLRRP